MGSVAYNKSIFKQFFESTDSGVVEWRDNMVDKLYKNGIIPKYIERGNAEEDEDYISFWTAVSEFFAYYVIYARQFQSFELNRELLLDYIYNKGVGESPEGSIEEFTYLMRRLYDDCRMRGTRRVFDRVPHGIDDVFDGVFVSDNTVHGEFVRSISHNYADEYAMVMTDPINFGWCVGRSSPMYRGTLLDYQLIKAYESTDYAVNKNSYPLTNGDNVSVFTDSAISKDILKLVSISSEPVGIGTDGSDSFYNPRKLIVVDQAVNYEITFQCKGITANSALDFYVKFYDDDFNEIMDVKYIDDTDSSGGVILDNRKMWKSGKYYFIRGILFGVNEPVRASSDSVLDFGAGKHLHIPCGTKYIMPFVQVHEIGNSSSQLYIYDFKVRIADTVYSRGFIQTPNVIQVWAKNNNGLYTKELQDLISVIHPISYRKIITIPLLEEFVRRYLIPYNSTIIFNWLSSESSCGVVNDGSYNSSYNISYDIN